MRTSLLTSAIVGLARRPLSAADEALAQQFVSPHASPAARALALCARASLHLRSQLICVQHQGWHTTPVPQHPIYGPRSLAVASYLQASAQLLGLPDAQLLLDQNLLVPAELLPWYMELTLRSRQVSPLHYSLLGERGVWLGTLQLRFRSKVSYLDDATPPAEARKAAAFFAYHLGRWAATGASAAPLLSAFRQNALPDADVALLARCLSAETGEALPLPNTRLLELANPRAADKQDSAAKGLSNVEQQLLRQALGEAVTAQTSQTPRAAAQTPDHFIAAGSAWLLNADWQNLQELLSHAIASDNTLITQHPELPVLLAHLPAAAYATSLDLLVITSPRGWKDEQVKRAVAYSAHPISLASSEDLLEQAVRGYAPLPQQPIVALLHKLHPQVVDLAYALAHDLPHSRAELLIKLLTAKNKLLNVH